MKKVASRVARKFIKKSSVNLELHVFDFDNTLFKSPEPPSWWSTRTYGYWYNLESSLGFPFLPVRTSRASWNSEVVRDAKDSINDLDVWSVMCTGRINTPSLRYRVAELLQDAGLDFDEVYLNGSGSKTLEYKKNLVKGLLQKHPNITRVVVWEDNESNLDGIEMVARDFGVGFEGHFINEPKMSSEHISEMEYIEALREDLPQAEWDVIEKKLKKKGILK